MSRVFVELDSKILKRLVYEELENLLGAAIKNPDKVRIEVKTKQNYKAEWETGDFRAIYEDLL
jgi:hypothetical protein